MSHEIPSRSQLEDLLGFAQQLADAAAKITLSHFRTDLNIINKLEADFDPVTKADKDAEAEIRVLIDSKFPNHGILGEEHGSRESQNGLTWVLDPIDGTRAFITGSPMWGTLIALNYNGRPILGVLDQPFMGERFWGVSLEDWRDAGLIDSNGARSLKTRACPDITNAVISTTTPEVFADGDELSAFDELRGVCQLTRYGGDCYGYAQLAMGFMDFVVESSLQPYDIQAVIPIVEGAGGIVTNWNGGNAAQGGRTIAAGDKTAHAAALKHLAIAD